VLKFEDLEVFKRAYIGEGEWQRWRDEYEQIAKMLQGLAKSVK
jgi:hypothetical protein